MDKKTKDFFEAIDKHGEFKFWVCPNMCMNFVDWDGDKATCRKCGADNTALELRGNSRAASDRPE